jgi:uncharacterized Tic20 family protein
MEEQISPEPDRRPDSADTTPTESAPAPALAPTPVPILAAQPTGGDPFQAVAPPPLPQISEPLPPFAVPAAPAPLITPPPVSPGPLAHSMPPILESAPPPKPSIAEPLLPPPPRVLEVEATGLSASDVRRPVVDAAPVSPPPPRPDFTIPEPKAAETQAAAAAAAPPPFPSPPPPPAPPPVSPRAPKPPSRFKRNAWAIACHLLLVLVIPTVFLGATLTFLIWQIKGKKSSHVEDQGREALNFQINVAAITAILTVSCLGAPLIVLVWFVAIVMAIIAARHAFHGENYRYPWVFRIVSH